MKLIRSAHNTPEESEKNVKTFQPIDLYCSALSNADSSRLLARHICGTKNSEKKDPVVIDFEEYLTEEFNNMNDCPYDFLSKKRVCRTLLFSTLRGKPRPSKTASAFNGRVETIYGIHGTVSATVLSIPKMTSSRMIVIVTDTIDITTLENIHQELVLISPGSIRIGSLNNQKNTIFITTKDKIEIGSSTYPPIMYSLENPSGKTWIEHNLEKLSFRFDGIGKGLDVR